jgi:hypothetical protein
LKLALNVGGGYLLELLLELLELLDDDELDDELLLLLLLLLELLLDDDESESSAWCMITLGKFLRCSRSPVEWREECFKLEAIHVASG